MEQHPKNVWKKNSLGKEIKINEVSDASCHRRPRIGRRNANLLKDVVPLLASVFVCYLKSPA